MATFTAVSNSRGGLAPKLKVNLSGPFFQRDVNATLRQNIRRMLEGIVTEGASEIAEALQAGEAGREPLGAGLTPDRASDYVVGRVKSLTGNPWALYGVVSINNHGLSPEQGIALMAGASEVERETHAFRRIASALRGAKAAIRANLTEGLE